MTKTTVLAAVLATTFATTSFAGGLAEPVMEPVIVVTETEDAASSAAAFLPRIIFTLITLAALN